MLSDRANGVCILEILKEYSDCDHPLSMKELLKKLHNIYDTKMDRRTVYSAVAMLSDLGYDISTYEENGKGYYLRSRTFDPSEILLLTDAVYSFSFISAKQTDQLIGKLQKQLSCHQRKQYKHLLVARPERKSNNKQVFWNIELINEAISMKRQISFTYLEYGPDKELHPRREKPYTVHPYKMVYMNNHYYLACSTKGHEDNLSHYRIDLMSDIELLNEPSVQKVSVSNSSQRLVYAFAGEPEQVTLHCDNHVLGDILDKFGTDIQVYKLDETRSAVTFRAATRGLAYWALQYLAHVEVVRPASVREEVMEILKNNPYSVPENLLWVQQITLSPEELNAELEKGYQDMLNEQTRLAEDVLADLKNDYQI